MARVPVPTRAAVPEDVPALIGLWAELRQVGGRAERAVNPTLAADVGDRLRALIAQRDARVIVALVDDVPVGMAIVQAGYVTPLSDATAVHLNHLVVTDGQRHHGVGHALVAAAASLAEEWGIEHVVSHVYPSMRDANRFFARLGFAPLVVRRIAPVAALRRRLAAAERPLVRPARLDVARRRSRLRGSRVTAQRRIEPNAVESLPEA